VEPRQILRSGITASALAHLSCLLLVVFFAEVHPFSTVTAEPIAVDIVAPEEVAKKVEEAKPELPPKEKEKPTLDLSSKVDPSGKAETPPKTASPSSPPPAEASAPPPAQPQATKSAQAAAPPSPQKQAALAPPTPPQSAAAAPAASPAPVPGQPPGGLQRAAPPPPVQPAYVAPAPDLSFQYPVLLGGLPQDRAGDGFDAPATEKADVGNDMIAEFRKHLKSCSKLPGDIAPTDQVAIKIRVAMTPEGRLAAEPVLIAGPPSMKGPLLMRSAISALEACQPYTMLPADKYREWKVLDLVLTPRDFTGAS
jgi:hypothetical protein